MRVTFDEAWMNDSSTRIDEALWLEPAEDLAGRAYGHDLATANGDGPVREDPAPGVHRQDVAVRYHQIDVFGGADV